jgi:hypothetical protein
MLSTGCIHHHHHHEHPSPPVVVVHEDRGGPPPHAPAHGYRHKHKHRRGHVDLVFDSGLGVYVVVGWPGHFFHDGRYYRYAERRWHSCDDLRGRWTVVAVERVPPRLAAHYAGKHKKHRRGGPHPAKHGY